MQSWGKIFGFIIGLGLIGRLGILGLFLGIYLGSLFDNALGKITKEYKKKHQDTPWEKDFIQNTFALLGHIAKIDGPVNQKTIDYIEQIMKNQDFSKSQRTQAINAFSYGKSPSFHLEQNMNKLRYYFMFNPEDKEHLLHLVKQVAMQKKPMSLQKVHLINQIYARFGQNVFTEDQFHWNNWNHSQYRGQYHNQNTTTVHNNNNWAYQTLGVSKNDSFEEITKKFRKLRSQFHPDRIQSKNPKASDTEIKKAHEKTIELQKAYEIIKKTKKA